MTSLPYADADCSLRALAGRAEGFGHFSVGGLHGDLYVVTSLADDGPGTLREGASTEYMQSCHLEKLNVEKRNVHLYRWKKRLGFDIVTLKNGSQATDSAKVYIYDWNMEDVVIGEGRLSSTDPKDLVNNLPIGQGAAIVTVDKVFMENVHLWRPISAEILTIGKAIHENIAWPIKHIQFFCSEEKESAPQKQSSSKSLTNSTGSTGSASKKKCILLDCNDSGKEVAEGRVMSTNPSDKVHFVPLGHNASKIMVEVVKIGEAKVWKPNSEVEIIADAIGTTVAWPNDKLVLWSYVQRFVLASYPKLGENKAKAAPKCNVTIEDDIRE